MKLEEKMEAACKARPSNKHDPNSYPDIGK